MITNQDEEFKEILKDVARRFPDAVLSPDEAGNFTIREVLRYNLFIPFFIESIGLAMQPGVKEAWLITYKNGARKLVVYLDKAEG